MDRVIRVLLVDDDPLVRSALALMLGGQSDIDVVGEAGDGQAGIELVEALQPDVVLMDIRMPGVDGLTATRRIAAEPRLADVKVVILTTFDLDEYVFEAVRAGAAGFLVKDTEPAELLRAVQTVAAGSVIFSAGIAVRVLQYLTAPPPELPQGVFDELTGRERSILEELAHGYSNAEIAESLVVTENTVKTHVARMLAKLGVRDRVQAVVLAYEAGLVRPTS